MTGKPKVAVVGLGVNNRPLVPFLYKRGMEVIVADKRETSDLHHVLWEMGLTDVKVLGGDSYLNDLSKVPDLATVYLTPGMVKNLPEIERMRKQGAAITCETDVFFQECPAPIIGITGSAGKTTTTTLVSQALSASGEKAVFTGGNIGHSLWEDWPNITPTSWVVMELSSFQLELVAHSPHGAAVLNLAPNHLDIHGTMQAYARAKSNIFRYQNPGDWVVFPYPPTVLYHMEARPPGRILYFSLQDHGQPGSFVADGKVMYRDFSHQIMSCFPVSVIQIPGSHNVLNVLAATAIVGMMQGRMSAMEEVVSRFRGVAHRLEKVRIHDNILYINDSIATAPDRTMAALRAIEGPIVLLAGGYDKHLDYAELGQAIARSLVHHVVVLGQVQDKLAHAIARYTTMPIEYADTFEDAVHMARRAAKPGDTVLLSPAAASYDMFRNFEERGERFREIVESF
ncbi:MAG: UDP-N-acetylmuramoyl-L-alanine--D-glutamate ligase [Sulfobacillus benefaciens]|uniref:UDP-N-acetylmuramoylalanine--D-glutamate ligase n=1 Tax=Sulfobacillus benefaciens TaxID=453960 RepID=A0A2T2X6T8_9FIRM|nr:MAG: UDP-N-acetylmuramoyl-L-alanine--D-glutamate ligase [Sulfobacillus benefaciens]